MVVCEKCGKSFEPKNPNRPSRWCSSTCRVNAFRERHGQRKAIPPPPPPPAKRTRVKKPPRKEPPKDRIPRYLEQEATGPEPACSPGHNCDRPPVPTTLLEFTSMFPDDEACSDYLVRLRWPDGFICPKCGSRTAWRIEGWRRWECPEGHQTSITAGTTMHRTKIPLRLWFFAAFLTTALTPGISALQLQKQLGISRYETAFHLLHKLRSAMVTPDPGRLQGHVEVNEGWIGGVEEGAGGRKFLDKSMIVLGVEILRWTEESKTRKGEVRQVQRMRAGRLRISMIPDGKKSTLIPWVQATIEEGSTVYTDGLSSYGCLGAAGYKHIEVIPDKSDPGSFLYMVHLIISNLKAWMLGTFHGAVSKKHLPAYLNEYVFRFNRRFWPGLAFQRALGLAMQAEEWPEYETLYDAGQRGGWEHPRIETDPYTLAC